MEKPRISFTVPRIFFEQFDAPSGEQDYEEIRREWGGILLKVVEAAGYECDYDFTASKNPALNWYLYCNGPQQPGQQIGWVRNEQLEINSDLIMIT